MPGRTRAIEKFAEATAKCTADVGNAHSAPYWSAADGFLQGAVYGKCVAANYQNVNKDMCAKEFMALKDCYLVFITLWQTRGDKLICYVRGPPAGKPSLIPCHLDKRMLLRQSFAMRCVR